MKIKIILILVLTAICLFAQESKKIYAGLRLGGGIGMVYPVDDNYMIFFGNNKSPYLKWRDGGSFDIAPFVNLQIIDKFAIQTEIMITRFGYFGGVFEFRKGGEIDIEKEQISRAALLFPILAKYTLRRNRFNFQLYAGPHFTANVGKYRQHIYYKYSKNGMVIFEETVINKSREYNFFSYIDSIKTPLMGLTLGTNFGFISTKAGTVFVDARFLGDLGIVKQYLDGGVHGGYRYEKGWWPYLYRAKLSLSLGWEFGFIDR